LAATEQPILRFAPGVPVLVVQAPEGVRQVLIGDATSYGRPWFVRSIMGEALGQTLFLAEDEEWLARRQSVAPVFGRAHVDGLAGKIATAISSEMATWNEGAVEDVQAKLTDLTFGVACHALLGIDPADEEVRRTLQQPFEVVLDWMSHRFHHFAAPPAVVPTKRNNTMRAARAEMRSAVERLVQRRREAGANSFDVLSLMLQSQFADENRTDADIVSDCIGFLFAGHETTASTLTWALYELATHPEDQEQVAQEGEALDLARDELFRAAEELKHTGRVVDEILRLYPAGIGIARVARKTTELCGHRVGRGTIVLIAVYPMQRAKAWSDPNQFNPQREFPAQPGEAGAPGYVPFGWGPRRCLGARFATIEARLALAMLCSQWVFTYEQTNPPRAAVIPSLRVDGQLPLRLTPRAYGHAGALA
jgi:cytochrome P450